MSSLIALLVAGLATCQALLVAPAAFAPHAARGAALRPRMLFGGGKSEGGDGGMGGLNMMETIKKAQQVGVKVKELQEELQNTEVEATAADGGVTVSVSGAQVPISVTVSDAVIAQGAEAVSTAVSLAAKEAHKNSMNYAKERMTELYTEIGLPMPPAA